jgi:hypothetical protein
MLALSFDPDTEEDYKLRQCLSLFFPLYAFSSGKVRLYLFSSPPPC